LRWVGAFAAYAAEAAYAADARTAAAAAADAADSAAEAAGHAAAEEDPDASFDEAAYPGLYDTWIGIEADIRAIEASADLTDGLSNLVERALTPFPEFAEDFSKKAYQRLARLRDDDPNWGVWLDWYEARLRGGAPDHAFEEALLGLSDADWAKEPAAVNAWLMELYRKKKPPPDVPEQDPRGGFFTRLVDGFVDFASTQEAGERLLNNPTLARMPALLHLRVSALQETYRGNNAVMGLLAPRVEAFKAQIPEALNDLLCEDRQFLFWDAGNSLRTSYERQLSLQNLNDPDSPAFPEPVIQALGEIIPLFNNLNNATAHGPRLDENASSPKPDRTRDEIDRLQRIGRLLAASADWATERVRNYFSNAFSSAKSAPSEVDGAEATTRNIFVSLAEGLLNIVTGAGKAVVAVEALNRAWSFLVANTDEIKAVLERISSRVWDVLQYVLDKGEDFFS